jgi:hypothetical protein
LTIAGTTAESTTTEPAGPTKEQIIAKIQELQRQLNKANKQITSKIKIKESNVYNREQAKLENFLQKLNIYFTARRGIDNTGKILFAASYFRETAASWFRPYIAGYTKNRGIGYPKVFESYKGFKKTLQDFFSDSDRQAALEQKILAIT